MATITIRNVDDAVYERWKARAKANHRSLESEVRLALSASSSEPVDVERLTLFQRRMRAKYGAVPDTLAVLRQMRDEG
jgi:plasmid stability protein